jgi:predicted kinase
MNKKVCYMLVGITGAGKSTIAKQLIEENPEAFVFSLDTLRLKLFESKDIGSPVKEQYSLAFNYANENRQEFDTLVNDEWAKALKSHVVIVDNMNHTRKSRAKWITSARAKGFTIVAIDVMCPLDVLIERQNTRADKSVPADVVRRSYYSYQELSVDEADIVIRINGITGMPINP